MQHNKHPVEQVVHGIETSLKSSPTAVGPAKAPPGDSTAKATPDSELVDAINQVFALFRINYHNQFYSAFNDTVLLDQAKRIWLEALGSFGAQAILAAARALIEQHDYLPTLKKMLDACDHQLITLGLPEAREAYLEACNRPSPKIAQDWSHPAVYHAGKATGWQQLAQQDEAVSWPIYQQHYRIFCQRALAGDPLTIDRPPALEQVQGEPLSSQQKQEKMRTLLKNLGW